MTKIDPETTVLRWLLIIGFILAVFWLSISAWRTIKHCQYKCIIQGFEQGHLKLHSLARGVAGTCECAAAK